MTPIYEMRGSELLAEINRHASLVKKLHTKEPTPDHIMEKMLEMIPTIMKDRPITPLFWPIKPRQKT